MTEVDDCTESEDPQPEAEAPESTQSDEQSEGLPGTPAESDPTGSDDDTPDGGT